jgi:DNA-binding MarR family transcriptional regulator
LAILQLLPTNNYDIRSVKKMGFLKRSMHSTDARGYVFSLSPTGRKLTLTLIKEFDSIQDLFEKSMGMKKTKEIMDGIQQLILIYRNGP